MATEVCKKIIYNPVFSIIIPVYNSEEGLRVCLDSIKSQTFSDFEVILINDGSTDESPLICDEYSLNDSRFRTIHIPNSGVSHARNIGIANARGKYTTFVDSDDYIEPNTLSSYWEAFKDNDNIDAVKCGYYREIIGSPKDVISIPTDKVFSDKNELFKLLEDSRYYSFVWNLCIKKTIFDNIRFLEDINWLEDQIFSYECYLKCDSIKVISAPLYHYVTRQLTQSSLSYVQDPGVIIKAINREYDLKIMLNDGKYSDMTHTIALNYLHSIHRLVSLLYTKSHNYKTRKSFKSISLKEKDFIYKDDKIFFCRFMPFILRDLIIKIIYNIRQKNER